MAAGWYYANTSTLRGWVIPLLCCSLTLGGLGYALGEDAAPRRFDLYYSGSTSRWAPPPTFKAIDHDTGAVWVGATMKDVREYYEWYSNCGGCLGVLVGLVAGAVMCRCRGPAPPRADPVRDLFLRDFPDEQTPLNTTAKSEQIRRLTSDITRNSPSALTDAETGSEA